MPQRRTAKKDLRKNEKRRCRNLKVKEQFKSAIKKFKKSLSSKDVSAAEQLLKETYKILDKAAAKKIIHRNKAARKKSRLAKLVSKTKSSNN